MAGHNSLQQDTVRLTLNQGKKQSQYCHQNNSFAVGFCPVNITEFSALHIYY
jgi:hypothetical protein